MQTHRPRRVACAIGGRTRRRKGQSTTAPSRRRRRVSGREESPASVPGPGIPRCTRARDGGASTFWQAAAVLLPQLCFIAVRTAFHDGFLALRAAQWNSTHHSACTARRHHSNACLRSGCAKNKSGYSRIRATDRKKRRDAVTNGQGRQGREDLQDQARPRRRNRVDGRHSARG